VFRREARVRPRQFATITPHLPQLGVQRVDIDIGVGEHEAGGGRRRLGVLFQAVTRAVLASSWACLQVIAPALSNAATAASNRPSARSRAAARNPAIGYPPASLRNKLTCHVQRWRLLTL
jgi:hypothetical protein